MARARILVAGVGNIFLGDDAFGVEVAHRLSAEALGPDVEVRDFGIRGLDLAYALAEGYQVVILVDATSRGGAPGTLYVLEPEAVSAPSAAVGGHDLTIPHALALAESLGGTLPVVCVVGCEPVCVEPGEEVWEPGGLSPPVQAAVGPALELIRGLVRTLLGEEPGQGERGVPA